MLPYHQEKIQHSPLPISTDVRTPGDALGALGALFTLGALEKVKWHTTAQFSLMGDLFKKIYLLLPCLRFLQNLFQIPILKHFFDRGKLSFFADDLSIQLSGKEVLPQGKRHISSVTTSDAQNLNR
jgi:hypothetical protein